MRLKKQVLVLDRSYRMALWGKHVVWHSGTETLVLFVALIANKGLYLVEMVRLLMGKLKSVSEHRLCYLIALRNLNIMHENT